MNSNATQRMPQPPNSRITRFKDTLSVNTAAANNKEQSAWSPATSPASSPPATAKALFIRFSLAKPRSASSEHTDSRSVSMASSPPLPRPPVESRLKSAFGRVLRQPASPTLPTITISRPIPLSGYGTPNYGDLPSFGPLTSEKPQPYSGRLDPTTAARRRRRRNIYIAAALIGSTILVVVIILVVRLVRPNNGSGRTAEPTGSPFPSASPSSTLTPSTSNLLTPEQSNCLTNFITLAPSVPLDYPVSCLKILQSVSAEFTTANPAGANTIEVANQFSALRLFFNGCSAAAQQGLSAGGWFKDTKFCVWTGVKCDGSGGVSQLTFTQPNVPTGIPADGIIALNKLVSFVVEGTGSLPSGSLPIIPPSLQFLELNNTALGPLDNSLFTKNGGLSKLETLVLVQNMNMGSSISDGIPNLSLKSMTVQNQGLVSLPSNFLNSTMTRSLTFLDLSNNALTNTVPDMSSFTNLATLNFASNNFTTISQTTSFPPTLQSVSFLGNQNLAGQLPAALCSSSTLKTCDFSKTLFLPLSCGVCKFN